MPGTAAAHAGVLAAYHIWFFTTVFCHLHTLSLRLMGIRRDGPGSWRARRKVICTLLASPLPTDSTFARLHQPALWPLLPNCTWWSKKEMLQYMRYLLFIHRESCRAPACGPQRTSCTSAQNATLKDCHTSSYWASVCKRQWFRVAKSERGWRSRWFYWKSHGHVGYSSHNRDHTWVPWTELVWIFFQESW